MTVLPSSREGRWALRLAEFNLHPARFAHASWYADRIQHLDPRSEPALSRWLLSQVDAAAQMDWDMSELPKRLWLLDAAAIRCAARELALAMHRDWLVRYVDGERVRRLQQKVSKDALRFVIAEVPPRSLQFSAPQVNFDTDSAVELNAKLEDVGARALMGLVQPTWRAVRARAQWVFARALRLAEVPVFEGEHYERARDLVLQRLIPRRLSAWVWLF